ncbi:MAG: hypothetical protein PHG16_12655 [Lachnospiraceae bacterium]|nr:hypothetical protein [Lachnospiraceae bacterium]
MEKSSLFRQESLERIESPEQMNAYIKISRPGIWILLAALLVLMGSSVVWAVTGTLPETMEVKGRTLENGQIRCYEPADSANLNLEGCAVKVRLPDGTVCLGKVLEVSTIPYSAEELSASIGSDWLADNLLTSGYSYEICIKSDADLKEDLLASVTITTDEVKPIQFILN